MKTITALVSADFAASVKLLTTDPYIFYMALTTYRKRDLIDYDSWEFISGAMKQYHKSFVNHPHLAIQGKIGTYAKAVEAVHEEYSALLAAGHSHKQAQRILTDKLND